MTTGVARRGPDRHERATGERRRCPARCSWPPSPRRRRRRRRCHRRGRPRGRPRADTGPVAAIATRLVMRRFCPIAPGGAITPGGRWTPRVRTSVTPPPGHPPASPLISTLTVPLPELPDFGAFAPTAGDRRSSRWPGCPRSQPPTRARMPKRRNLMTRTPLRMAAAAAAAAIAITGTVTSASAAPVDATTGEVPSFQEFLGLHATGPRRPVHRQRRRARGSNGGMRKFYDCMVDPGAEERRRRRPHRQHRQRRRRQVERLAGAQPDLLRQHQLRHEPRRVVHGDGRRRRPVGGRLDERQLRPRPGPGRQLQHAQQQRACSRSSPVKTTQYLARAFFPSTSEASRNVLVDDSVFTSGSWTPANILGHELGHTLGFRHEHTRPEAGTCFEDNNWRPLTPYDSASIMHYPQCNGGSTNLQFQRTTAPASARSTAADQLVSSTTSWHRLVARPSGGTTIWCTTSVARPRPAPALSGSRAAGRV